MVDEIEKHNTLSDIVPWYMPDVLTGQDKDYMRRFYRNSPCWIYDMMEMDEE